jgi:uncharacterized protein YegP (UPF0339 family)
MPKLEVHQRDDNRWGWRLTADNGRIIATDGGQGYENRADCQAMASAVVDGHYGNPTEEPRTVNTNHHVDVVITHGKADTTPLDEGVEQEPEQVDVVAKPKRTRAPK